MDIGTVVSQMSEKLRQSLTYFGWSEQIVSENGPSSSQTFCKANTIKCSVSPSPLSFPHFPLSNRLQKYV